MGCDQSWNIPPNQYSSSNEMLVYFETSSTGHTYHGFQLEYTSSCKSSFPLLPSEYSRALSCQSKYFKFIKCSLLLEIGYLLQKGHVFNNVNIYVNFHFEKLVTVKLGNKECFNLEQIGFKEPFPVTNCQFPS